MKNTTREIQPVRKIDSDFIAFAIPLIEEGSFLRAKDIRQHGNTTRFSHCVSVAYYSLKTAARLKIPCNARSLVRGGMLHDYYFYDRREKNISQFKNSFIHPKAAVFNAVRDYNVSPLEQNIIVRHMFPITLIPPKYREGLIVCITDKICGLAETFGISKLPLPDCAELWQGKTSSTPRE
ncbi:MAG: HD domain-containing protein [Oscillospiraceae bacterium]